MADPQQETPDFIPAQKQDAQPDFIPASGSASGEKKPEEPGFLDKDIPLSGPWYNPTLSGVQSIGRGFRGIARGIGQTISHPIDTAESTVDSIAELPGQIKEVPNAIHDINQSADPVGAYAKVAQDTAGQGAAQALTAIGTEGAAKLAPEVATPVASRLYRSALKPSTTLGGSRIARMVDTGLNEAIPVSEGGETKLGRAIGDTNDKIQSTIDAAPTKTISKGKVLQRLNPVANRFSQQVNPASDLDAIAKSGNEFSETAPSDIPGPDAQRMKQGTYRAIGDKKFGELGGAATESQKALARGLKEELANQYPELNDLNAHDSRLIDLQDSLEKAVVRHGNRSPLSLSGPLIGAGAKIATGSSPIGMGAFGLKAALSDPAVSSALAIALNKTGKIIARPGVGAAVGAGTSLPSAGRRIETQP